MVRNDFPIDRERHSRIKYELDRRGLSLAEIARRVGVGLPAVSSVSLGRSRSARIEAHLAQALGMTAPQLFPERYPEENKGGAT